MDKNIDKLEFGRLLNASGPDGSVGHTECHDYGSFSGCDGGCPALWRGECEVIADVLENVNFNEDDLIEIKGIYVISK